MAATLRQLVNVLITTETYGPTAGTVLVSTDVLDDIKQFLEIPVNTNDVREKIRELVAAVIAEQSAHDNSLEKWIATRSGNSLEARIAVRALRERIENELIELYREND